MPDRLLLKDCRLLATMDEGLGELRGASVLIAGNRIEGIGDAAELEKAFGPAGETLDMTGCVVLPGLVNAHHHFFQTLTRALPGAQDAELFDWLKTLYPIWAGLTPEMVRVSTQVAAAELLLSGCTTAADHLYLYPNGCTLDDAIEAAGEAGLRFVATRGALSVGESQGGLPPDSLCEDEEAILLDMERVVGRHHDAGFAAMTQVALAPCSPFSVSRDLMRETATLARRLKVGLHTHLAETGGDVAYSRERFGRTPAEYAEDLGWTGPDVWFAHCVRLDPAGINLFGRTGTGVAHCPCSNMRLGSGIAPVRAMLDAGVKVGLGVDGSASNDGGHLLGEARHAMLLARVGGDPAALSAREVLRMATREGAAALNRDDVGRLAPGMAADVAAFRVDGIAHAGALHDPLASLVFCRPADAWYTVVDGRVVVREGRLTTLDPSTLVPAHNRLAARLVGGGA
ncbi:MAG: 8-oxoguanine deaminase [Geminicoccaceae bacterium]|nr:8-oxoguanine deaminase [Geminicoccaceae bacterium]